jgi:hypothetical protein
MNIEQQDSCIDSIVHALTRTSEFRARKAKQYDDPRNSEAVLTLTLLATIASQRGQDYWQLLQPFYVGPDASDWLEALSLETKAVGFSNRSRSLAFFMQRRVRQLSQSSSFAA